AASIAIQRRPNDADTVYAPTDETEQPRTGMGNESPGNQQVPRGAATPRKMTGYLGMNPGADKELNKLRKSAGAQNVLASMGDAALEDKLLENPGITEFVFDDLKIPPSKVDRWSKAMDALEKAGPSVRDALAELMRWMNRAEDGEIILDRLVLSGHSNGFELWGTGVPGSKQHPGVLVVEQDLTNVAAAFPNAAGQVRSIMFSACETVGAVETVVRVFPNVDSVWSYAGFSPDVDSGSSEHVQGWEQATKDGGTPGKQDAKGATALWTHKDKFLVRDPGKGDIQTLFTNAMAEFGGPVRQVIRGQKPLNKDELKHIYERIQAVIQHPGLTAGQKGEARDAMEVLLRLRHWESISRHFETYRAKLAPAYKALGVVQPAWSTVTRAQLFEHAKELKKAWESHPDQTSARDLTQTYFFDGIYGLTDKKVIPPDWNE
ncbi:MAG TPA: hypothetical protein VKA30_06000, partial [Actinomycetota bacterium]|nr:hypothetical protein [Actinomycetota bacterium]